MNSLTEEIHYIAYSACIISSGAFSALAWTSGKVFVLPAGIALLQAFCHFVAMKAAHDRRVNT